MKKFLCPCGNHLYFGNTFCLSCGKDAGFCPQCWQMTTLLPVGGDQYQCGHSQCGQLLRKCRNDVVENVCNCGIRVENSTGTTQELCEHCQLTAVIPDLSIPGNRELWARLEDAKRRVLFTIHRIGLPIGRPENRVRPVLAFQFEADAHKRVMTGHDQGTITINIREADDVEREKARVQFREPQRTLVGHIRHELGHFYWDVLIAGKQEEEFRAYFGDERQPTYSDALDNYYWNGPQANWQNRFISAYASLHPWEDFAETFGTYLDMLSILDTALPLTEKQLRNLECEQMLHEYREVGLLANEMNREMGLKDLVPEVFGTEVTKKICFIHRLVAAAATGSDSGRD